MAAMGVGVTGPIGWDALPPGNSRIPCPSCGRGPKDRTCGVTVHVTGGIAHCFRCGYVESQGRGLAGPIDQVREPGPRFNGATFSDYARNLWNECLPLRGVPLAYLNARNCVIPPSDGDLRCHAALRHPSGHVGPALVALITHAELGHPMSLHRTWVCANGDKAKLEHPRLLLKGHPKDRGVIRLWPDDAVALGLGVAEGIETALSLAHAFQPVWALVDAGNLSTFAPLAGIESMLIGADNDEAGVKAANQCAQRWASAGREVRVAVPPGPKQDLNDLARTA